VQKAMFFTSGGSMRRSSSSVKIKIRAPAKRFMKI
jgi:hypothetical protein